MNAPLERVVVWLDAAVDDRHAIDTAARLAAGANAPLHGIFVEDEELLHLAALPFARQVTLGAGAERFTSAHAELHLRAAASRARRRFAAAAGRHRARCSFEIVRGLSDPVAIAASERDLVVIGAASRPVGRHFCVAARWWSAIETAPAAFLVARRAWSAGGAAVILLRDRSAGSARALEKAARIAAASGAPLTVISPPAVAGGKGFRKWLADRLAGMPVRLEIEVAPSNPTALHRRIGELDCHLLAIEPGFAEGSGDRLREFVDGFACDVLIAR